MKNFIKWAGQAFVAFSVIFTVIYITVLFMTTMIK